MPTANIPKRANTLDLENDKFAVDCYDNIVTRVADDCATAEVAAIALMRNVIDVTTYNNVCRSQESGAIFYDLYNGSELQRTIKIELNPSGWCVDTVGLILLEDGFEMLQEDGFGIKRE